MEDARVVHARPELFAAPNHGFAWIRMIGAILVIYGHSSPLVGTGELFPPEWALQPDEGVLMGFFALSGFQITESWRRDPHPARFAAKRVLRLWPPMLTVSFGMALLIGPLVTTLSPGDYFSASDTWGYIVNNASLLALQHDLPGVFVNNPWPDAVNGSLWTLPMELLAYAGLYTLLLFGAAKHRFRWLAVAALVGLVLWDRYLEHDPGTESAGSLFSVPVESLVAFLVAFAIGVVLNLYRIPLSPLAAAVGVLLFLLMPNSVTASFWMTIAISYGVIVTGHFWPVQLTVPGLWINGSYGVYVWSFPIQQLLAMAGIGNQYLMLLCAAAIAYVAGTLSWAFVEEPTMRLRHYITPQPRSELDESRAEDRHADDPDWEDPDWGDPDWQDRAWDEDEDPDDWESRDGVPVPGATRDRVDLPEGDGRIPESAAESTELLRPVAPEHRRPSPPNGSPPGGSPPAVPAPAGTSGAGSSAPPRVGRPRTPAPPPQAPGRPRTAGPRPTPEPAQSAELAQPAEPTRPPQRTQRPEPSQTQASSARASEPARRLSGSLEPGPEAPTRPDGRHAAPEPHDGTPPQEETRPIWRPEVEQQGGRRRRRRA